MRAVRATIVGPRGRATTGADVTLGGGLVLRDGELALRADAMPAADAGLVLAVAGAAPRTTGSRSLAQPWRGSARNRPSSTAPGPRTSADALVSLLDAGDPSIDVFETLDQHNLVTRVLPEWRTVRNRPQRNAFHRFTVDRHLVECAVRASRLTRQCTVPTCSSSRPGSTTSARGHPGDHVDTGVELMRTISRRMGFDPADVDTLTELVRHHLLLASIATSRDLDDPATIEAVAATVGTVERLDLLHALTEADSLATGEAAWSPWKARLVQQLVDRVRAALGGEQRPVRPPAPASDQELAARAGGDLLVEGSDRSVVIAAPDQPRLFSRVVGVLGLSGQDVHAARARSTDDGTAISEFDIEPAFGEPPDWTAFEADLRRALRGRIAIDARLAEPRRALRRLHRPSAAAPPETSRHHRQRRLPGRDLRRGAHRRRHRRALRDRAHVSRICSSTSVMRRSTRWATRSSTASISSPRTGRSSSNPSSSASSRPPSDSCSTGSA